MAGRVVRGWWKSVLVPWVLPAVVLGEGVFRGLGRSFAAPTAEFEIFYSTPPQRPTQGNAGHLYCLDRTGTLRDLFGRKGRAHHLCLSSTSSCLSSVSLFSVVAKNFVTNIATTTYRLTMHSIPRGLGAYMVARTPKVIVKYHLAN